MVLTQRGSIFGVLVFQVGPFSNYLYWIGILVIPLLLTLDWFKKHEDGKWYFLFNEGKIYWNKSRKRRFYENMNFHRKIRTGMHMEKSETFSSFDGYRASFSSKECHVFIPVFYIRVICMGKVWRTPWCNGYRRKKWRLWPEIKFWTSMFPFLIGIIPLGTEWIQPLSVQLWVK